MSEFELGSRRKSVSVAASVHSNPNPKDVSLALCSSGVASCNSEEQVERTGWMYHTLATARCQAGRMYTREAHECVHTLSDMGTLFLPTSQ